MLTLTNMASPLASLASQAMGTAGAILVIVGTHEMS